MEWKDRRSRANSLKSDEKTRYVKKKLHETEKNMAAVKKALDSYLRSHERMCCGNGWMDGGSFTTRRKDSEEEV